MTLTLVILDEEGEQRHSLPGVELYDLTNRYWSDQVVDWVADSIKDINEEENE